jgi:hypothetical protein
LAKAKLPYLIDMQMRRKEVTLDKASGDTSELPQIPWKDIIG